MEFILVDGKKDSWTLGKVTARREKALSELKIIRENFGEEGDKGVTEVIKKILDECGEDLIKFISILFEGRPITKDELEDIDKVEVQKGVMGFFLADLELMSEYNDFLTTLSSLK